MADIFGRHQPHHRPNHIKHASDLRVGEVVVVHIVFEGEPKMMRATVSHINVAAQTLRFREWGTGDRDWADYGLVPYRAGAILSTVDISGLWHQQHWLEHVAMT